MAAEIGRLLLIFFGIFVVVQVTRRWFYDIRFGTIGVILILLPVGLSIYEDVHPVTQLLFIVPGLFVVFADASKAVKRALEAKNQ